MRYFKGERNTSKFLMHIDPSIKNLLDDFSTIWGISKAAVIRTIILDWVREHGKPSRRQIADAKGRESMVD